MIGLFWISVTTVSGKAIPVRIENIDSVYPNTGAIGGSRIYFTRGGAPLEVNETPAQIYTAIDTKCSAYLTALGDP